jgi:hypothetical protein
MKLPEYDWGEHEGYNPKILVMLSQWYFYMIYAYGPKYFSNLLITVTGWYRTKRPKHCGHFMISCASH